MKPILFAHNKATWYRIPFFLGIAKYYPIEFIFTNEGQIIDFNAHYCIAKRWGKNQISISPTLYYIILKRQFSLAILPPADTIGELMDVTISAILLKIKNVPFIVWSERWKSENTKRSFKRSVYQKFDEAIMRIVCFFSCACATSGGIKQKEYFKNLGVAENKIYVIPYVSEFSLQELMDISLKKSDNVPSTGDKKVILYVGRLIKRKGADHLIKVFSELRKKRSGICLIVIGGSGFYGYKDPFAFTHQGLIDYSISLGLVPDKDIFFLGDIPHHHLPSYYQSCDIFVLPASAEIDIEPWGLVVNEAMSFGKPVIATEAVGSAYTLIQNGENGFIIPEKDGRALEEKIVYLLDNTEIANKIGENAKKFIDNHYRYHHMVDAFRGMIDSIVVLSE